MTKKELKSAQEKLEMLRNGKAATEKMNDAECLELYGISKAQVLKNVNSAITRTEQDIYRAEHPLTGIDRNLTGIASNHLIAVAEQGDLETRHSGAEDFFEVSVWDLKAALKAAYDAGRRSQ